MRMFFFISGVRHSEQKYLLYSAMVNAIVGSIIPVTPTIASVITISIYTAVGNSLSASTVAFLFCINHTAQSNRSPDNSHMLWVLKKLSQRNRLQYSVHLIFLSFGIIGFIVEV